MKVTRNISSTNITVGDVERAVTKSDTPIGQSDQMLFSEIPETHQYTHMYGKKLL